MQTPEQRRGEVVSNRADWTVQALINDVDEFLSYLAIVKTSDVDAIRDRLERSLVAAKRELYTAANRQDGHSSGHRGLEFIRLHPWLAVGAAAALGAMLGAASRLRRHSGR